MIPFELQCNQDPLFQLKKRKLQVEKIGREREVKRTRAICCPIVGTYSQKKKQVLALLGEVDAVSTVLAGTFTGKQVYVYVKG